MCRLKLTGQFCEFSVFKSKIAKKRTDYPFAPLILGAHLIVTKLCMRNAPVEVQNPVYPGYDSRFPRGQLDLGTVLPVPAPFATEGFESAKNTMYSKQNSTINDGPIVESTLCVGSGSPRQQLDFGVEIPTPVTHTRVGNIPLRIAMQSEQFISANGIIQDQIDPSELMDLSHNAQAELDRELAKKSAEESRFAYKFPADQSEYFSLVGDEQLKDLPDEYYRDGRIQIVSFHEAVRLYRYGFDVGDFLEVFHHNDRQKLFDVIRSLQIIRLRGGNVSKQRSSARVLPVTSSRPYVEKEFVLHYRGYSRVSKPVEFSHSSFLRWIKGESSWIYVSQKGSVPVLNPGGVTLLKGRNLHPRVVSELYGRVCVASVTWGELKATSAKADVLRKTLKIGGLFLDSVQKLRKLESFFQKHRPLFRFAEKFLSGDKSVDCNRLAVDLEFRVFPPHKRQAAIDLLASSTLSASAPEWYPTYPGLSYQDEEGYVAAPVPEWPSVMLQGNTNSRSAIGNYAREAAQEAAQVLEHEEFASTMGQDFGSGMVRGIKSELFDDTASFVRPLLNSVIGLTSMAMSQTPTQFFLAAAQTLVNDPVAFGLIQSLKPSIVLQGSDEKPDTPWYTKIAGLSFISGMRHLIGEVYAALVPSFMEICGAIKFASLKEFATMIATKLANVFLEFMNRVKACFSECSLRPLLGVDANRWVRHAQGVIRYKAYIVSNDNGKQFLTLKANDELPPSFTRHMTYSDFVEEIDLLLEQGEQLRDYVSEKARLSFDQAIIRLKNERADCAFILSGSSTRPTPFVVMFSGPPGIAKSHDADTYARALCRMEGRSENDIYYFRDENFRTMLRPSTAVVRMDDPDNSPSTPTAGFEDYSSFIQHLVNGTPYPIEQAAVEEKGRHFAKVTDLVITSNSTDLRVTSKTLDPQAIWRRISFWVHPKVKSEYAHPDGRLDYTRSLPANPCTYTVYEYASSATNNTLCRREVARDIEWKPLMRMLLEQRSRHLGRQFQLMNSQAEVCAGCQFALDRCVCEDDFELQGSVHSAMSNAATGLLDSDAWEEHFMKLSRYFQETRGLGLITGLTAGIGTLLGIGLLFKTIVDFQGRDFGLEHDSWFRADPAYRPALPTNPPVTWSFEQMCSQIALNMGKVTGQRMNMFGVVYQPSWVLFPTHVFGNDGNAVFEIRNMKCYLRKDSCILHPNAEIALAYVSELSVCTGIRTYWAQFPVDVKAMGDGHLVYPQETRSVGTVRPELVHGQTAWKYDPVTENGDCGGLLVASGPGGGHRIFGMHLFRVGDSYSAAADLTRQSIDAAIGRIEPVRAIFQGGKSKLMDQITNLPARSEVNVAVTFYNSNAHVWGSFRAPGRTIKTQFKKTSFHDRVIEWAKERQIFHDYAIPEFRGGMDESTGLYFSPYIHALRDSNRSTTEYMDCVVPYAQRFWGHYGPELSEEQAIRGVPGQFNSVNVRTSMGPPVGGPKSAHIDKIAAEMSPLICEQIDELESCLARREVPKVVAECVLKDEVLKKGKNARVFCMLPAAFNIVAKRRFAPLKRAQRASYFASQCFVGMDFGSRKCEDFVDGFKGFPYLYDLDVERMDKMWTPRLWDAVAETVRLVTERSAGDVVGWEAWALVMSLKEAFMCIKGDLFSAFWNPSGNDITVELNSIALSLMMVKMMSLMGVDMVIATYGDDFMGGCFEPLPPDFFQRFKEVTGFTITSADKSSTPQAGNIRTVSFLKRNFRFDEEYECWTAPLARSSIVKMLLYRGKSELSSLDHECALVEAAARYGVLHGREFYSDLSGLLQEVCPEARRPDYDAAMKSYYEGVFTDWIDRTVVHDGSPSLSEDKIPSSVVVQGKNLFNTMSLNQIEQSIGSNLQTTSSVGAEQRMSVMEDRDCCEDVVQVCEGTEVVEAPGPRRFLSLGAQPVTHLNDFLERWTMIRVTDLSQADTPMTFVDTFTPASLLLSNTEVTQKTRNWTFFRGDIELMGILAFPGNASGAYVVTARPECDVLDQNPEPQLCLAFEHSSLIMVSSSPDVLMTLPYFSRFDSSLLSAPTQGGTWKIHLTCLSPVLSAISGGVTKGKITWYARFKEYELLVPRYQGASLQSSVVYQGKQDASQPQKQIQSQPKVSAALGSLSDAASQFSGFPVVGPVASAMQRAAGAASAVAGFLGFSRENESQQLSQMATRSVTNVANVDGPDSCAVSGFSVRNRVSIEPAILGSEPEDAMSFESMGQRWSCVDHFAWSASNQTGDTLSNVYITPGYGPGTAGDWIPTGAGYCLLPFEYWRADAEYLLVVPASVLHRGTLQVLYAPYGTNTPGAGVPSVNSTYNALLDISSTSTFHIDVGYTRNAPMSRLVYANSANASILLSATDSHNGRLLVRVVNPLVSPAETDVIHVSLFVRFKNIQGAVPRTTVSWTDTNNNIVVSAWEDGVQLQGKASGDDQQRVEDNVVALVPTTGPYPVQSVVAGEEVRSLRALAQRPSRLYYYGKYLQILAGGYGVFTGTGQQMRLTTAALAMAPFIYGAASERVRYFPQIPTFVGVYRFPVGAPGTSIAAHAGVFPAAAPMTFTGPQYGAEFSVPYYFPRRGKIWRWNTAYNDATFPEDVVVVNGGSAIGGNARIYYSLGDDIRVGPFMRIPKLVFAQAAVAAPQWDMHPEALQPEAE